jgi:hypothetical protein
MSMKRVVSAAALATGLSISTMLNPGFANAAPMDPPPPCPNCHGGGGGGGGGGGNPGGAPQAPQSQPQTHEPPSTQSQPPASQSTEPPATHSSQPPAMTSQPPATPSKQPPETQSTQPSGTHSSEPPRTETTQPGAQTTAPSAQTTTPANEHSTPPSKPGVTVVLNPPSTQPPHPAYVPRHDLVTASTQIGGPGGQGDVTVNFIVPGRGAPPPPPPRGFGWNDGPAPHRPPPNWVGPPPPGGWDGPPPAGGWNRPWQGPPRDEVVARADFGPFAYNTFTVVPVFNWQYGGWGYWFFGVWVPLY